MEKDIRKHIITHDTAMDICLGILCILERENGKMKTEIKMKKAMLWTK